MIVKWKTLRDSFPYLCIYCGEFSNSEKEYCEKCGKKNSLRKITREDYENHIEKIKAEAPKMKISPKENGIDLKRAKKIKTIKMIVICFCAFLIIDIIGFLIIMNMLGIPLNQISDNLWVFSILLIFTLVMFIIIIILVYFLYYTPEEIIYWLP
ncbi:MAG: hypothetical protein ACFFHD_11645 [Promethearchaeota archaeon]